jgi:hypothetical protein
MGERVMFGSSTGPNLAGIIDVPEGVVRGWGVFSHGFTLAGWRNASTAMTILKTVLEKPEMDASSNS